MALVSYDSSDCSDFDSDEGVKSLPGQYTGKNVNTTSSKPLIVTTDIQENFLNLFQSLPKPSHKEIKEEDDEFLHKHVAVKKEKTKISIPSLSDFKDVDDFSIVKKLNRASENKCGLLSILPEPKLSGGSKYISKPLIPNVVERKFSEINPPNKIKKTLVIEDGSTSKAMNRNRLFTTSDSDEGDQEDTSLDFFSIYSQQPEIIPETDGINFLVKKDTSKETNSIKYKDRSNVVPDVPESRQSRVEINNSRQNSVDNSQLADVESRQISNIQLDDEALRQLCGSRKRHKKEHIEVITVDQQQVLSDSREWLVKGLMDDTSKRVSASKKRGNEPTNQQKRKHQITYLAHQAKANEAELQNQWANNRMSKRQTQSKYGF